MGAEWTESNSVEKDLGILTDKKLNVSCQHMVAAQKVNHILSCIISNVARRLEMVLLQFSTLMRLQLKYCVQL